MLWLSLAFVSVSMVVGVLLVLRRWQDGDVSLWWILGHGVPAVAGVVLAWIPVSRSPLSDLADVGIVLMAATAVGGLGLLAWQLWKGRFSLPLALIHALVGVAGFLLLLLWAVTRPRF